YLCTTAKLATWLPQRVSLGHSVISGPLWPTLRTQVGHLARSENCHKPTFAGAAKTQLFEPPAPPHSGRRLPHQPPVAHCPLRFLRIVEYHFCELGLADV